MSHAATADRNESRPGTFAALGNANFRKFLVGQGISLCGTWLQSAAVAWIVYDRTKSERISGLIEAASIVPGLLVGVLAGALADRVVPRTMILFSQLAQLLLAFVLAELVYTGSDQIWHLAVIVALTRVFATFEMPARQVFLFDVVGREMMVNAIALNSGLFNASRVLGPSLAGLCLDRFGEAPCFALNGLSYIASMTALLLIHIPARKHKETSLNRRDLLGGFAYLAHDRRVRSLYLVMTAFGLLGGGFTALAPAYAQRVIGTGTRGYSMLLASSGVGATVGALLVASLGWVERRERIVVSGILGFSVSLVAAALLPTLAGALGGTGRLIMGSIALLGAGMGAIVFYAATQTMIQSAVPESLRGRIMGIWMLVYSGSVPLGCLWAGELAQAIGVGNVLKLCAAMCATLGLTAWLTGALRARADFTSTQPVP